MAKRRGSGEGSILHRKDGRWLARMTLEDGKRKEFYGATQKEVRDRLHEAQAARLRGTLATGPRQTLRTFISSWLTDIARHTVRPSTYDGYERLLHKHVLPILGGTVLQKLLPQDLQAYYSTKLAEGLSPRYVQMMHAVLHRALGQAVRWDLIVRNPADLVDAPLPRRIPINPLTTSQTRQLLSAAKDDRLYALYVLAVTTGLRQGELLGLRWADVDPTAASLMVMQQYQRLKGTGITFVEPKTARGRRPIALPAVAVRALNAHRENQEVERTTAGEDWCETGLVFTNLIGKPLDRPNLTERSFHPLLEKAGLPSIRFHDLRHTAATLLLTQGVHPKVVQERLGHSTIAVTMDVYSHVLPDMQLEAAMKIDDLFPDN